MSDFHLRLRLDPGADHRAQLQAYPADALRPDFVVVTSGMIAIDLGPIAVAYRHGRRVALPAGSDDPAAWLPDYLGGWLERLAQAVLAVRPGRPTAAHLLDAPAALTFTQAGRRLGVRFVDDRVVVAHVTVPVREARATVASALDEFRAALLVLNPRLADHPDVQALARYRSALASDG